MSPRPDDPFATHSAWAPARTPGMRVRADGAGVYARLGFRASGAVTEYRPTWA